jgi:hypothetical protein
MSRSLIILFTFFTISSVNTQTKPDSMETKKPYTILVLLNATPNWLSLSRDERNEFFAKDILPIFKRLSKTVKAGFYDSEYFHSAVSDFMIITASDLDEYKLLIELLRDTKIYSIPYFEVKDIITGQENLFEDFNNKLKKEKQ